METSLDTAPLERTLRRFVLDSLLDREYPTHWRFSFRGSALPCCPRQLMFGTLTHQQKLERTSSFQEQYFFSVGRAIHTLVQETWAQQGVLWGDWQCADHQCGFKFQNTMLPEGRCLRCGHEASYVEKHLLHPETGFSGHCDGVVFVKELRGFVVVELKSRNSNIISAATEPYRSDLYQVSTYATLLSRQFWIPILGRAILWIGKPRPKPFNLWFYPGTGHELAEAEFEKKRDLDRKMARGQILEVPGRCEEVKDGDGCPFAGICFSPKRERLTQEIYEEYLAGVSGE